jgi:hypothetical protein
MRSYEDAGHEHASLTTLSLSLLPGLMGCDEYSS